MVKGINAQVDVYVSALQLVSPSTKSAKNHVHFFSCKMNVSPRYKIMVDGSFFAKTDHLGWGFYDLSYD